MSKHPQGSAVIEVLISLSLAAFLIASLGNLITSTRRLETANNYRQRALAYARESLEMMASLPNNLFACVGSCSCTPLPGYNSCWVDLESTGPYHLQETAGSWQLVLGNEAVPGDSFFIRGITINNMQRDANGILTSSGITDTNTKKITVRLSWQERGEPKSLELATILTAWANITP